MLLQKLDRAGVDGRRPWGRQLRDEEHGDDVECNEAHQKSGPEPPAECHRDGADCDHDHERPHDRPERPQVVLGIPDVAQEALCTHVGQPQEDEPGNGAQEDPPPGDALFHDIVHPKGRQHDDRHHPAGVGVAVEGDVAHSRQGVDNVEEGREPVRATQRQRGPQRHGDPDRPHASSRQPDQCQHDQCRNEIPTGVSPDVDQGP